MAVVVVAVVEVLSFDLGTVGCTQGADVAPIFAIENVE